MRGGAGKQGEVERGGGECGVGQGRLDETEERKGREQEEIREEGTTKGGWNE